MHHAAFIKERGSVFCLWEILDAAHQTSSFLAPKEGWSNSVETIGNSYRYSTTKILQHKRSITPQNKDTLNSNPWSVATSATVSSKQLQRSFIIRYPIVFGQCSVLPEPPITKLPLIPSSDQYSLCFDTVFELRWAIMPIDIGDMSTAVAEIGVGRVAIGHADVWILLQSYPAFHQGTEY